MTQRKFEHRRVKYLVILAFIVFFGMPLSGCENEPVEAEVATAAPPPVRRTTRPVGKGTSKKSTGLTTTARGVDWRRVRAVDTSGEAVAVPKPNADVVWAQATIARPSEFAGLADPFLDTPLTELVLEAYLEKHYHLPIGSAIMWNQPVHLIWVEPLPSTPIVVATVRSTEDIKVRLPKEGRLMDRRGNLYTFNISLTQTTYVNFVEKNVVLSPHWRDFPLLREHIAKLTSAPPLSLVRYSSSTVEQTEELVRYSRLLNPQGEPLASIWDSIETFQAAYCSQAALIEAELDLDSFGQLQLSLRLKPEATPEAPQLKTPDASEPPVQSKSSFALWLEQTTSPEIVDIFQGIPLESVRELYLQAFDAVPREARTLRSSLALQDPFASLETLRFERPRALLEAERTRAYAMSSPVLQAVVDGPKGQPVFLVRATIHDIATFKQATEARNQALLALQGEGLPLFTLPESPLPLELPTGSAPEYHVALQISPPQSKPRKVGTPPSGDSWLIEVIQGNQLYVAVGPGARPLMKGLLTGTDTSAATRVWLAGVAARHERALVLVDVASREGSDTSAGSLTASVRTEPEALILELSMPRNTLMERFAPKQ